MYTILSTPWGNFDITMISRGIILTQEYFGVISPNVC